MASGAIAIPKRKDKQRAITDGSPTSFASPKTPQSSSFASSLQTASSSYGSPNMASELSSSTPNSVRRRESLMSATFSRAEHTVINVGDAESPRLISCVKASQGFDWNQEIFLPSYADYTFDDLERRQDPVEDIIVTEEEVRNMLPS